MEIYVAQSELDRCGEPLLIVGSYEDLTELPASLRGLDLSLGGALSRLRELGDFRGKAKETRIAYGTGVEGAPTRVLLVGLGKRADADLDAVRRAAAEAAVQGRALRTGRLAYAMPFADALPLDAQARAVVEGAELGLYEFRRYRPKPQEDAVPVRKVTLVVSGDADPDDLGAAVALGRIVAEAENYCRDLANTSGMDATPAWMAEQARGLSGEVGLAVTVIEQEEMEREGMGGLLGVARGSDQPPKLVVLEHNAGRDDLDTVCLVGKGITFDSGGISIKPAENMQDMKFDKAGACAVFGAMRAVAMLDLPLHVVGIAPFAENMPSGKSYRPGDVLTCSNGKTIEVHNTDAEGRLVLADALVLASKYEPRAIVDVATLTGACMIALGNQCGGLMTVDDGLARRLVRAGEASGQRVWRLPLFKEYKEQIKSDIADMKNLGGRFAGAITAACLLQEFVGDRPWAHLDIAGVAWRDSDRDYLRKGATGFGVRLFVEFLREWTNGGRS